MLRISRRIDPDIPAIRFGFMIPDRNLVTPPKLPADTPIADVLNPVLKALDPALWPKLNLSGSDRSQGTINLRISKEPLFAQSRLAGAPSVVALSDVGVV